MACLITGSFTFPFKVIWMSCERELWLIREGKCRGAWSMSDVNSMLKCVRIMLLMV